MEEALAVDSRQSRFVAALASKPYLILDGALATELEKHPGCDLGQEGDKLWSARVLANNPELVYKTHLAYLLSGEADVIITASYQASTRGLTDAGFSDDEASQLIEQSVILAKRAVADAAVAAEQSLSSTHRPATDSSAYTTDSKSRFVAGSVGPYGAYLADGSEYTGSYSLSISSLQNFHRPRMRILLDAGVDVLACETIPSFTELEALLLLLVELQAHAWVSVTLRDAQHMSDGTPLVDVGRLLDAAAQVVAIGVNCVAPRFVSGALRELGRVSSKPLVVYPNSGEGYDATTKRWVPASQTDCDGASDGAQEHWTARYVGEWYNAGARLIGGCCRTTPDDMRAIRRILHSVSKDE